MPDKFDNLFNLLEFDKEADRYFKSLPGHVQESIGQRAQNVKTFESLKNYAENLTRMDD